VDRRPDLPSGKGLVIAEGVLVVQRMLASRFRPRALLGTDRRLGELEADLADAEWRATSLEQRLRDFAAAKALKLGAAAQPLRVALTGSVASPGIFEIMEVLGRDETLARIADAAAGGT